MLAVDATAHARQRRELDRLMPCSRPEKRAWTARTAPTSSSQALMQEERRSAVPVHADCAIHTCHPRQLRGVGGGITTARRNIDALGAATMRIWRFKLPAVVRRNTSHQHPDAHVSP